MRIRSAIGGLVGLGVGGKCLAQLLDRGLHGLWIQFGWGLDDAHGGDADCDDSFDEVDDVARVVVFLAPGVGVVDDARSI